MSKLILAAALTVVCALTVVPAAANAAPTPAPCEKMLEDVKKTAASAKLADAEKAKVADLQAKGIERCKADDDAGADGFFADALKAMSVK